MAHIGLDSLPDEILLIIFKNILPELQFNKTTKLIPFVSSNLKKYNFKIKWGQQTSTDDTEGDILNYNDMDYFMG